MTGKMNKGLVFKTFRMKNKTKFLYFSFRFPEFLAAGINYLRNFANCLWNIEINTDRNPPKFVPDLKYKMNVNLIKGNKSNEVLLSYHM